MPRLNPLDITFEVTQADIDASRGHRHDCARCLVACVINRTLERNDLEVGLFTVMCNDRAIYRLDCRGSGLRYAFDNGEPFGVGDKFSLVENKK